MIQSPFHNKRTSLSFSRLAIEDTYDFTVKLLHTVSYNKIFFGHSDIPILICQIAFIKQLKQSISKPNKLLNPTTFDQRINYGLDLDAFVFCFSIEKEKGFFADVSSGSGGEIDQSLTWTLPNAVKLSLIPNPSKIPDRPSEPLLSTMSSHMLWNDCETFICWLKRQWFSLDIDRILTGNDILTESKQG